MILDYRHFIPLIKPLKNSQKKEINIILDKLWK